MTPFDKKSISQKTHNLSNNDRKCVMYDKQFRSSSSKSIDTLNTSSLISNIESSAHMITTLHTGFIKLKLKAEIQNQVIKVLVCE